MLQEDRERLLDIITYCDQVLELAQTLERLDLEDFRNSNALAYSVQTIGEASSKLSADFRSIHSGIEWKKITDMRHRIVHGYGLLDRDILWAVACDEVPVLRIRVLAILESGD